MKVVPVDADQSRSTEVTTLAWLIRLKAIAILWIVLNHVVERIAGSPYIANPNASWPPLEDRIDQLAPIEAPGLLMPVVNLVRWIGWSGDQGVQLFLIASGFGLTWSLLHRAGEGGSVAALPFLRKRLRRIYPEWLVVHVGWALVAIGLLVGLGVEVGFYPWDWRFWASLVGYRLTPNILYFGSPSWWYFGLIVQLYLIFPLLWRWLVTWGPVRFLLTVGTVSIAIRLAGLLVFEEYLDAWSRGAVFVSRLPEFALGMSFAVWWWRNPDRARSWLTRRIAPVAGIGMWFAGSALSLTLAGNAVSPVILGTGAVLTLAPWLMKERAAGALTSWVSDHSYSWYLAHHPPIRVLLAGAVLERSAVVVGAAAAVALGAGVVGALLVERVVAWFRSGHVLRKLAIVTTSLVVIGVVAIGAELAVQRWNPQEVEGWGERASLRADDRLQWTMKPDSSTRLRWLTYDYTAIANVLGFPGTAYPEGNTAGVFRVVTLGDAFTSAEGVDTDDAWPRLLEARLEASGVDAEVMNFAITGYGPQHHAVIAETFFDRYRPDLVVVQAFVNDFEDTTRSRRDFENSIGFGRRSAFSLGTTLELTHLRQLLHRTVREPLAAAIGDRPEREGYFLGNFSAFETGWLDTTADEFIDTSDHLSRVKRAADLVGADLLLMVVPASIQVCDATELDYFPNHVDIDDADLFDLDLPQRMFSSIADALAVEFIDLRIAFAEAPCVYQPGNMHWVSEGHEIVAEVLADRIALTGEG